MQTHKLTHDRLKSNALKDKKRGFVGILERAALIDHTVCECLSEIQVHLCLDTDNEFDDKTV